MFALFVIVEVLCSSLTIIGEELYELTVDFVPTTTFPSGVGHGLRTQGLIGQGLIRHGSTCLLHGFAPTPKPVQCALIEHYLD